MPGVAGITGVFQSTRLGPVKTIVFCVEVGGQVVGVGFPQRTHLGYQARQQAHSAAETSC